MAKMSACFHLMAIAGFVISTAITPALAAGQSCKAQTAKPSACRSVAGELDITADDGSLIWLGGDTKKLAVRGNPEMPASLTAIFDRDITAQVYGDFLVCPLPGKSPLGEENVCIESASHLAVVPLRYEPNNPGP
jgi:hypothetical protein